MAINDDKYTMKDDESSVGIGKWIVIGTIIGGLILGAVIFLKPAKTEKSVKTKVASISPKSETTRQPSPSPKKENVPLSQKSALTTELPGKSQTTKSIESSPLSPEKENAFQPKEDVSIVKSLKESQPTAFVESPSLPIKKDTSLISQPQVEPTILYFAFGSSYFLSKEIIFIKEFSSLISKYKGTITIDGYTDAIGTKDYNMELSMNRAKRAQEFLKKYLLEIGGYKNKIWEIKAHGEKNPIADNNYSQGRSKNRRVKITFKH